MFAGAEDGVEDEDDEQDEGKAFDLLICLWECKLTRPVSGNNLGGRESCYAWAKSDEYYAW